MRDSSNLERLGLSRFLVIYRGREAAGTARRPSTESAFEARESYDRLLDLERYGAALQVA